MPFRGITLEPIHKNIQARLEEMKVIAAYGNPEKPGVTDPLSQVNINNKTVWYRLTSNAGVVKGGAIIPPQFAQMGTGIKYKTADGTYWSDNTARPDMSFTPPPGVESINVSTKGALGSIKTADFKIKVWHPEDMEHIEKAYMSPGITCFLEWGWSDGPGAIASHDPDKPENSGLKGLENIEGSASSLEDRIIAQKLGLGEGDSAPLANRVEQNTQQILDKKPGQYDGMLGVITKFNWSLAGDGSYDCNISMISPNSLTMGVKLETTLLGAFKTTGYKKSGGTYKQQLNDAGINISTKVGITDGEFLCHHLKNMLFNKGFENKQVEVEVSISII